MIPAVVLGLGATLLAVTGLSRTGLSASVNDASDARANSAPESGAQPSGPAVGASPAVQRTPVLPQIRIPHSYYYREMYLPQVTKNPNRVQKHFQYQVIMKPSPAAIQDIYIESLRSLGVVLEDHDLRFDEDNWESPTIGAWGVGWQVLLDGLEITQFTYFQQCGGIDLSPVPVEITYGLERLEMFLEQKDDIYDLDWSSDVSYRDLRLREEKEFSEYNFNAASIAMLRQAFAACQKEAARLVGKDLLLPAYDMCLKCSHNFNLLDSRGAISVTERVKMISQIRALVNDIARRYTAGKEGG